MAISDADIATLERLVLQLFHDQLRPLIEDMVAREASRITVEVVVRETSDSV